jgi:hypothetical protein
MMKRVMALVAFLSGIATAAAALADESPGANASAPAAAVSNGTSTTTAAPPRSQLWSYQPVKSQDVPAVKQRKWVRTPIDAFVLAKLESKGLAPSPDSDRGV